ncbi:hypothetical protein EI94DRAFT_1792305 [Lactarius quietus]|nr:hypothetical protein EI94DRAFT_1792305 [Lactarius quietus]
MEAVTVRTVWVMIKNIAVYWLCKIANLQVHESRYPLGNKGNFRSRIVDLTYYSRNVLVKAMVLVAEAAEEGVPGLLPDVRDNSSGQALRRKGSLRPPASSSANASDRGICEIVVLMMPRFQDAGKMGWHWTLLERQSPGPTPSSPLKEDAISMDAEVHEYEANV